jgi:acetylornithine deacetylase/succinyl-diaminopimelate desuccinylase-like protein
MNASALPGRNRLREVTMERRNDVASYSSVDELVHRCLIAAGEFVEDIIALTMEIASIPAPTFYEADRARFLARAMVGLGLPDITVDDLSNVTARVPGRDRTKSIILAGHIDTVFPLETPIVIERNGDRLLGPGIGDNSLGAAAAIMIPSILDRLGIVPGVDVVVTGNVGEEGLGDLNGIRAVVDANPDVAAVVAIEGHNLGRVTHIAVGSKRFRVVVTGPGGHSWGDFGRPNAIHAAAELIHNLTRISTPSVPKTTLTVGMIEGGISVNTIAPQVSFLIDTRSVDDGWLNKTVHRIERVLRDGVHGVKVTWEIIGDRPAGSVSADSPIIHHAFDVIREIGLNPIADASSTDANVSISRGIPSVCIGLTTGGHAHRVDEYIDIGPIARGLAQLTALTILIGEDLTAGI